MKFFMTWRLKIILNVQIKSKNKNKNGKFERSMIMCEKVEKNHPEFCLLKKIKIDKKKRVINEYLKTTWRKQSVKMDW